MTLPKLALMPDEPSYSGAIGTGFYYNALGGGSGRRRRKFIGTVHTFSLTFTLSGVAYDYWWAFYGTVIAEGSLPFLIDLIVDEAEPATYQASMLPDTHQISGVAGEARVVTFEVEVVPTIRDADYDNALVLLYGQYGEEGPGFLAALEQLVNVRMPDAFE